MLWPSSQPHWTQALVYDQQSVGSSPGLGTYVLEQDYYCFCKAVGPLCCVMHITEPVCCVMHITEPVIVIRRGSAQRFLVLAADCATVPRELLHGAM